MQKEIIKYYNNDIKRRSIFPIEFHKDLKFCARVLEILPLTFVVHFCILQYKIQNYLSIFRDDFDIF